MTAPTSPDPVLPDRSAPRLFLVDGYALIYRAFFALISRPLTTSRGENTSAAWGVVNFLNRLLEKHQPDYLGWVHDSGLSFRHEVYPEYKATREKLTSELQADFDRGMERICELLEAYHVPIISLKGYEADDVIGTLARHAVEASVDVVIVSGDKDFQQLVRPGVWLLNPGRGGPASVEESWVSVENGSERLGVAPEHVVDYLALVGDTSDNVPGVKGIGDKGARDLVNTWGSIENILAHVDEIPGKRPREALQTQGDLARLSKSLVTIRDDLDVSLDLERMRIQSPDQSRLRSLLVELEFHTLARLIPTVESTAVPAQATIATTYQTVDTPAGVAEVVRRAREVGRIAIDVQTMSHADAPAAGDPLRSTLLGIAIAVAEGEAYYLPLAHREREPAQGSLLLGDAPAAPPTGGRAKAKKASAPATPTSIAGRALAAGPQPVRNLGPINGPELEPLRAMLADPAIHKVARDAKFMRLVLREAGVAAAGIDFDVMIASYLLDPGRRSHELDVLALEFLGHQRTSLEDLCGKGKDLIPLDQAPVACVRDYAGEDVDLLLRLHARFAPQLDELHLRPLFDEVEMPLVAVLEEMQRVGVAIDLPWFASLKERFTRERLRVEQEIYAAAGQEFNINSNPQLREILFEKMGLPVLKRTQTGPSTDVTVLQQLAEEGHALPTLLMEYREISKLESTYIDALPVLVHPATGRIHSTFSQTVAATGRLSSNNPNLQNIPIRRELGRDIRRGFVPPAGHLLLAADYSQIELRLLAHLSGDPAFVEAFRTGGDIHRQTAALIFDTPLDTVTSEMRAQAKTINFATIYGQGAHALAQQLRIPHAEAKAFIERYFERFARVRAYLDDQVALARDQGYVSTIFGRRRYVPEIRERNFNIRAFGERLAQNSPIQGSAADLIKVAMIRIDAALRAQRVPARLILQVHDELVFEVPEDDVEPITELVRREMEHAAELTVPLVVDVGTGRNWLESK